MYTQPAVKKAIEENTNPEEMFKDIYEALEALDINGFTQRKVVGTDVRYFQIGLENFSGSKLISGINLGTSHSERYYLITKDNKLEAIVATETGGGYLNRGRSAYFHSFYTIYGDCGFDLTKIKNVSQFLDAVKNYVSPFDNEIETIEDLPEKELKSFLKSAFTKNYGKEPVFFTSNTTNDNTKRISGKEFINLFRKKMKSKIKDFHNKYPQSIGAYTISEAEVGIVEFLNKRFKNQLIITLGDNKNSIENIQIKNELFDFLYKDKLSELDYYFYYYDIGFKKIEDKLSSHHIHKIIFSTQESILVHIVKREPKYAFIELMEKNMMRYEEDLETKTLSSLRIAISEEHVAIENKFHKIKTDIEKKLSSYFGKEDISYSLDVIDRIYDIQRIVVEIKITAIDEK